MNVAELRNALDLGAQGLAMHALIRELYPICRSITGDGFRQSLDILSRQISLERHEVATGTQVFDWTVPKEWNIKDAYIQDEGGRRVVDFRASNLHVLNYSTPIREKVALDELKKHLFSLPDHPDWIPYRTSYYKEAWGFCVTHNQFLALTDPAYDVCIDSTLADGHLTYGEAYLPGEIEDEILLSCHACHPSLANDNLSGMSVAVALAKALAGAKRRYSYRFLFIPGTIGSITWLARNEARLSRIKHGLVLANLGDAGRMTYKKSRRGQATIDRAATRVLRRAGDDFEIQEFSPYGYDERQYNSPGIDLPVGCLSRTPFARFPEYHTSADNLDFVKPASLADSFAKILAILAEIESDRVYVSRNPKGEPQLGRRGLYHSVGGTSSPDDEMAMLWVLNGSDGRQGLNDIAERANLPIDTIRRAAERLLQHDLLEERC